MNSAGNMDIDEEMASMQDEERDAFLAPLNTKEVHKMEVSGMSLLDEITSGL